jgi:daunorubicin resistance ABC transporter ATP-binding subunit
MGEIPAIETERLTKSFGSTQALSGLDLTVPQGGILGLLGPNGAGKTTAVRVLATLLRPDSGHARVLGADVVRQAADVRSRIGLTGQYAALDDYLTGRANLVMIGQLSRLSRAEARRRADDLLARFDLTRAAGRAVKTYSGGMRRRLDLAASLIGHPEVLFLDEPTTGLDPNSRAVMWEIIRELAAEGTTLLLTTQYLEEADQLASQVAVIDAGRVVAEGTPDQLKAKVGEDRIAVQLAGGSDLAAAVAVVQGQTTGTVEADPGQLLVTAQMPAREGVTTDVVRALDAAGIRVTDVTLRRSSLDDVFMILTGHRAGPEPAAGGDAGQQAATGPAATSQGGAAA